ncbi:MAG: TonB-dependent receptor [Gammaproteobacteria bacterium]
MTLFTDASAAFRVAIAGVLLSLSNVPAHAQSQTSEDIIEEVIVTGTYIKRSKTTGALPVSVLDRQELETLGAPTTTELVNNLVINTGSENRSNALGGQNRNTGTSNINLRGLGLDKTLVLFNGKRQTIHATSASGGSFASFVDINLIPSIVIDRIEILKDGAAATYGSDAIAGVVNFLTRKDFEGLEIQTSYRDRTESASQATWDVSALWGWSNDSTNLVVAGAYTDVEQLAGDEVDWTTPQFEANRGVSTLAAPGALILTPDFTDAAQVANLTSYIGSFGALAPVAQALISGGAPNIDPTCEANNGVPFNILGGTTDLGYPPEFGRCGYTFVQHYNLEDDQKKINLWSTLETEIGADSTLYAEAAYYRVDVSDIGNSPSFPVLRFEVIPAENPGNFLGVDGIYLGRPFGQNFPTEPSFRDYETYRFVGGLRGTLGDAWEYDTSISYSSNNVLESSPTVLQQRFSDALDGLGGPNCDTVNGTPGVGNCQWFNPFSTRFTDPALANDPAVENFMRSSNDLDQTADLLVIDAVVSRDLWEMGSGTVQGAFGVQYRDEGLEVKRNEEATIPDNFIFVGGGTQIDESQDIFAVFGELAIPITDRLEAQAALRYEDYGSEIGDTVDPKLALLWQATDTLALRASASTTFRGPSLHQRFNRETALIPFVDVPVGGGTPSTGYKAAETVGNPSLDPETATTFNIGLIVTNLGNFNMTLDYWNIDFEDLIAAENAQTKVTIENTLCNARTPDCRDPDILRNPLPGEDPDDNLQHSGEISKVISRFINAPTVKTSGVDLSASYGIDTDSLGFFTLGLDYSYMFEYEIGGIPGVVDGEVTDVTIDAVGSRNEQNIATSLPQWRANAYVDWSFGSNHTARAVMRHIDEYEDDKTVDRLFNDVIDSWTTFDLYYTYLFSNQRTSLHVNVTNLTDEDPPFADQDLNFDARIHSPFGRQYQVVFRHNFDF